MQKFLRLRTPPSSPHVSSVLLCSSSLSPPKTLFKLIPVSIRPESSTGFGLKPDKNSYVIMPATINYTNSTAFNHPCVGYVSTKTPYFSSAVPFSRRGMVAKAGEGCLCATTTLRPWVVFKEARRGTRLTWLHTEAGGGEGSEEGGESEGEGDGGKGEKRESGTNAASEEKRVVRMQRRRNSGDVMIAGNPDLLTIPGVGPRNLRKLVDKGFGAVAELKQLYRDKV